MRARLVLLIAVLSLSTCGCAQCILESMVYLFPQAYTGGGATTDAKLDDLDQMIEANQSYK